MEEDQRPHDRPLRSLRAPHGAARGRRRRAEGEGRARRDRAARLSLLRGAAPSADGGPARRADRGEAGPDHAAPGTAGLRVPGHLADGGQQAAERQAPRFERTDLRGRASRGREQQRRNPMMDASAPMQRAPGRRATLLLCLWAACALLASPARAVVLDDENKIELVLKDNTHVTLYGQAGPSSGIKTDNYY